MFKKYRIRKLQAQLTEYEHRLAIHINPPSGLQNYCNGLSHIGYSCCARHLQQLIKITEDKLNCLAQPRERL